MLTAELAGGPPLTGWAREPPLRRLTSSDTDCHGGGDSLTDPTMAHDRSADGASLHLATSSGASWHGRRAALAPTHRARRAEAGG